MFISGVVGSIRRAGFRKKVGLLRPGPHGTKCTVMCRGHGVPSTIDGDTGNEDNSSFARVFKLDNDKFKIIITLRHAQIFGDTGLYKNFNFS